MYSKEITNSAIQTFKGRVHDPIIGSYLLSFFIYNWEIVLYLLSQKNVDEKISIIKKSSTLFVSYDLSAISLVANFLKSPFVAPLIGTFIYLFLLPLGFRKLYEYILIMKVDLENDRIKIERKLTPNSLIIKQLEDRLHDEIEKNNTLNELKISQKKQVDLINEESLHLKKDMKKLEANNRKLEAEIEALKTKRPKTEAERALAALKEKDCVTDFIEVANRITMSDLYVNSSFVKENVEAIRLLATWQLVERINEEGRSSFWSLTPLGMEVLKLSDRQHG